MRIEIQRKGWKRLFGHVLRMKKIVYIQYIWAPNVKKKKGGPRRFYFKWRNRRNTVMSSDLITNMCRLYSIARRCSAVKRDIDV